MISDMRAKYGKDSVNLEDCGKFTLAEDLSDISDITSIDLSGIGSLEGEPLEKFPGVFFCAPVRTFEECSYRRNFPPSSFRFDGLLSPSLDLVATFPQHI